jgi:hypothetical protein
VLLSMGILLGKQGVVVKTEWEIALEQQVVFVKTA